MCREISMSSGIPLDEVTLSMMSEEEQAFWKDFLEEAEQLIDKKEKENETRPYTPTESLNTKYGIAITDYDGEEYCQIRHLQSVFVF